MPKSKKIHVKVGDIVIIISGFHKNETGEIIHVETFDKLQRPQQFAIKTEYDLQAEYLDLIKSGADVSIRRSGMDRYAEKAFNGNELSKKRYELIKLFDWLYGMTDTELTNRKLLGTAQTKDFVKHDMCDFIMNQIIAERGELWFLTESNNSIIQVMNTMVEPYLPNVMQMP